VILQNCAAGVALRSVGGDFELERFLTAQAPVYAQALVELNSGRKRSHWMWFVFPQLAGLGHSPTARYYAIGSRAEAEAYLRHAVLGGRLRECTAAVLAVEGRTLAEIFGFPDDLKFRSCMTLFAAVDEEPSPFTRALERYCGGQPDPRTLSLLGHMPG
jgi:uncharacterized protein (DUF1810 family)